MLISQVWKPFVEVHILWWLRGLELEQLPKEGYQDNELSVLILEIENKKIIKIKIEK